MSTYNTGLSHQPVEYMAEITLLRHGQASFGADDYDQLSELGHRQAFWLGQYLKEQNQTFDRIVIGTMVRHIQTARSLLEGLGYDLEFESHAGLNEYNFRGLLAPLKEQHSEQWVETGHARRDYYHNMKLALTYWMNGTIASDGQDSWEAFCERIEKGFKFTYESSAKRTLMVSSGGPISVILAQVLQLDDLRTRDITLQIKNSSTSKLLYNRESFTLDSFNDIGHLRSAERQHAITFS